MDTGVSLAHSTSGRNRLIVGSRESMILKNITDLLKTLNNYNHIF